jgi:hypothetical protein
MLCQQGKIKQLSNDHRILRNGEINPERERTLALVGFDINNVQF